MRLHGSGAKRSSMVGTTPKQTGPPLAAAGPGFVVASPSCGASHQKAAPSASTTATTGTRRVVCTGRNGSELALSLETSKDRRVAAAVLRWVSVAAPANDVAPRPGR